MADAAVDPVMVGAASSSSSQLFQQALPWCRTLAPLSSLVFYFAPIPTMLQMRRDQTVGVSPLLPYTTMVLSNFLWLSYGVLRRESSILFANGTGFLLGCLYFAQYLSLLSFQTNSKVSPSSSRQVQQQQQQSSLLPGTVTQHVQSIVTLILMVLLTIWGSNHQFLPVQDPATLLGTAAVVLSCAMFASPLVALKTVIETQSARAISLGSVLATIANNFLWGFLGYFDMKDVHLSTQGAIGLLMGLVQLVLKLWYGNGTITIDTSTRQARGRMKRVNSNLVGRGGGSSDTDEDEPTLETVSLMENAHTTDIAKLTIRGNKHASSFALPSP